MSDRHNINKSFLACKGADKPVSIFRSAELLTVVYVENNALKKNLGKRGFVHTVHILHHLKTKREFATREKKRKKRKREL